MKRLFLCMVRVTVLLLLTITVPSFTFAQRTVTGTVKESGTGDPLIGANVLIRGSIQGTITDVDGKFSLEVPEGNNVLEVSYTGFGTEIITLDGSNNIEILLTAGKQLEEVVVTGYGTQRQREITSAVSSIKAEDFNKGAITSPAQLLQGKVPGLIIAKPNGDPNGGFSIRLRGLSTVGGNTEPLIIIDGVPGASLNTVDPQDIETMDVLRDGSGAAIYGTRGSNGVIMITTKKGKEGRTAVEYNGIASVESLAQAPSVMNAAEYKKAGGLDQGSSTDWFDVITRNAYQHQHNLALSGGAKGMSYRVSFNYKDIQGIQFGTGFTQLNGRVSLSQKAINDKLTIGFDIAATNRDQEIGFRDAFRYATYFNPTAPVKDAANKVNGGYFEPGGFDYFNPLAIIEQNSNTGQFTNLLATIRGEYEIIKNLKYSIAYTFGRDNSHGQRYFSKQSQFGTGLGRSGLASQSTFTGLNDYLSTILKYSFSAAGADWNALAGYDYQEFTGEGFSATGGNFLTDFFTSNNLGASLDFPRGLGSVNSGKGSDKLIAFFGRLSANFNDLIFANASIRQEGSTRFGANNKWGIFPAVSAGINVSRLIDLGVINNLKVRIGYGVTGANINQNYLSLYRYGPTGNFYYNGAYVPTYGPVSNPNPDLKWEKKGEINVGLEFGALDYKITGTIDFFNRKINDLLYNFPVPVPPNAFGNTWANVGELTSTGLEILANLNDMKFGSVKWTPSLNATFYLSNKLVSLSDGNLKFGSGGVLDLAGVGSPGQNNYTMIRVAEGDKIGLIYGPVFNGVDEKGDPKFKDLNGDGKIESAGLDRQVLGNGLPTITLGLNNTFNAGNWSLNFFFRGAFGHSLVNQYRVFYEDYNAGSIKNYNRILTKLSDPKIKNAQYSSIHVEKADFLRLDNLQLGYNLPMTGAFSKAFIYLAGNNLFTITNYSGIDPEVRFVDDETGNPLAPGIDRRTNYFTSRSFSLGLTLGF
ncbi:MAG: SusC/RagA family TonB-linked outer membrane protein [Saprospiraceae bacterium]|nr:SusC/RagA family TonB-linked outer membrane protein [Saprospiraceae bacterium]